MKYVVCFLFLLTLPVVLAQNYTAYVNVTTANNTALVKVGPQFVKSYDCAAIASYVDVATIEVPDTSCELETVNQTIKDVCGQNMDYVREAVSNISNECRPLIQNYEEAFNYYDPYLGCVANVTKCNDEVEKLNNDLDDLGGVNDDFAECEASLDSTKNDVASCQSALNTANAELVSVKKTRDDYGSQRWILLVVGAAAGFAVQEYRKRKGQAKNPTESGQEPPQ